MPAHLPRRALAGTTLLAAACMASGCAVVSVVGATAGAVVSVAGTVVSTGVSVTGKVIEKTIDAVAPGDAKTE
ncbi:MAG: hypothetical protein JSR68_05115 [Proteobacteria bacterium]|nr:hypothetical protein [Pseudomonadota bacterium]